METGGDARGQHAGDDLGQEKPGDGRAIEAQRLGGYSASHDHVEEE